VIRNYPAGRGENEKGKKASEAYGTASSETQMHYERLR
jgi:hypothetical protein